MKSKGFLDDIEKLVEDFSKEEKKQINTHINRVNSGINTMWGRMDRQQYTDSLENFRNHYLQRYIGEWNTITTPTSIRKETIGCRCGAVIEISFTQERERGIGNTYDWTRRRTVEISMETDHFYCPICRLENRIVGKIKGLKVKVME
jgi:hypothetical protein